MSCHAMSCDECDVMRRDGMRCGCDAVWLCDVVDCEVMCRHHTATKICASQTLRPPREVTLQLHEIFQRHQALAMKSRTPTSPNIPPATKSDSPLFVSLSFCCSSFLLLFLSMMCAFCCSCFSNSPDF